MRTFAQKPKPTLAANPSPLAKGRPTLSGPGYQSNQSLLRSLENSATRRASPAHGPALEAESPASAFPRFARDLSQIPVHAPARAILQTKLRVNTPGDAYEQEADRVAEEVMRMPEPQLQRNGADGGGYFGCQNPQAPPVCLQTQRVQASATGAMVAPPIVHEVLRSSGQSLDPTTRAFMEPRFGHEFGNVRIHTGPQAATAAASIQARAFTLGRDVVFAAGEHDPRSESDKRLLAHELTHVVQQRRSYVPGQPAISAPGDFHERQADVVAEAALGGRNVLGLLNCNLGFSAPSIQRQPAGTAPTSQPAAPPPPPLDYDRSSHTLSPLPPSHTAASIRKLLNDKIKAGDITSFTTSNVTSGSNAEIFVLYAIWGLSQKAGWGTEADIITAIDWPAKPGDPAPQGRVTVRIDTQGAASAELVGAGPVPAVAQTTAAAGSAKLKTDFGFSSVKDDGSAAWSDAEISDVAAALAMLPAADKPALQGVELIRVQSLGGNTAGEFSSGGGVASGATTATKPFLKLADLAFPKTAVQFYGGTKGTVPASFQTILHEVGHAVEKEVFRAAQGASAQAIIAQNTAVGPLNETVATLKPLNDKRAALFAKWKAAAGAEKEALRKEIEALDAKIKPIRATYETRRAKYEAAETAANVKKAEVEKTKGSAATIQPLQSDAAAKKVAAASALTGAKAAVQALQADEISSSAAFTKAVEDTATAIATFVTQAAAGGKSVEDLESTVLASVTARNTERDTLAKAVPGHKALAALDPAIAAQDAWLEAERVYARARNRTLRLQKFIDLVTTNKIQRFTQYSKENWLLKPQEFYAEAYSLWLVDPQFLETNYKVVYDFFQTGDYRK